MIEDIGRLITRKEESCIIVSVEGIVLWHSISNSKLFVGKTIDGQEISTILGLNLEELINVKSPIVNLLGKKYRLNTEAFSIDDNEYYAIFIKDIDNFKDSDTMLYCLNEIVENINDGVLVSDRQGKIILYNKAQEKLEEISANKIVGKYLWEAYNYQAVEMSEHQKVFKSGEAIENRYKAHSYKDGIPKYLSYSTYPIVRDGNIIAVYSVSKNETMLKSLLSETIELKRKLLSKVKDKDNSLNNGTYYTFTDIVGDSRELQKIIKDTQTVAMMENNILIVGETGTGKEVFAQSIHNYGKNNKQPFVAINCAAIPENLLESTLFGTTKGSYTGAIDQEGLFIKAKGGTLFFDELNSMPIAMQTKLLRVLQERKVRRVGSLSTEPVNCRVICAVNEDPHKCVRDGRIRQDLFYRIASFCVYIPPLRERKEDIVALSDYFIGRFNNTLSKRIKGLSKELEDIMSYYSWPGNVRELEHTIENLMIRIGDGEEILRIKHLPDYMKTTIISENANSNIRKKESTLPEALREIEKSMIMESLNRNDWNISKTSRDLGIIRQSLLYRMKKLEID